MNNRTLTALRNRLAAYLSDTCTIERRVQATDVYGAPIEDSWVAVASNVACRVITSDNSSNSSNSSLSGEQEHITEQYRLIVPTSQTLDVDYRVTVNSETYNIISLVTERTDETDHQAIMIRNELA